jgi:hypothetical protein
MTLINDSSTTEAYMTVDGHNRKIVGYPVSQCLCPYCERLLSVGSSGNTVLRFCHRCDIIQADGTIAHGTMRRKENGTMAAKMILSVFNDEQHARQLIASLPFRQPVKDALLKVLLGAKCPGAELRLSEERGSLIAFYIALARPPFPLFQYESTKELVEGMVFADMNDKGEIGGFEVLTPFVPSEVVAAINLAIS